MKRNAGRAAGALLLGALVGCSRGATAPAPAAWRLPKATAVQATAQQVLNDAYFLPADDGTTWVPHRVNHRPGAVRVGDTTRADLLRRFGYPTQRDLRPDGAEVWVYAGALQPPEVNARVVNTQRIAMQRKLVLAFAKDSAVVTEYHTYVTGERQPDPFRDTGPPFPLLEPLVIPAPSQPLPPDLEPEPIQPFFP